MISDRPPVIIGLLLAGGKGTRMGGQDKGMLPWQGQPMARWVFRALATVTPEVFISANRSLGDYEQLAPGHVLQDPRNFCHQGPLAGLLAGLRAAAREGATAVLVCPCDTPGITPATLDALVIAWESRPDRPVIAESEGRTHPLHGVYPVNLMVPLQQWLESGNRRVMGFAKSAGAVVVDCPEAGEVFRNRNKPDDLL
ncbi:molybdenum cofactor guanylyltransferase MobA [Marinobacter sp.]|uniref:molybdenum cofactor guanylyltransferase MobA n=1 Tax=Marinobacter sp. TaxID=50741 RepID=UPI00356AD920